MEGFKGTPGKWFYSDSLGEVKSLKGLLIADLIVNGKEDDNGRLIAAAPELLEALQAVVAVADRATDEFDMARAAIKKALGH
ncbi:hypothetical protein RN053_21170 [Pantoea dispersa]|uniref:hypothetical protein n=1 Tax=Pantoea dispersa TaxID=59814 RepID=UPI0028E0210D|nr:hypothetical protein [Pantoea dispersa]MDT8853023.1 hypothetical protein [Pantoea dispersa]